MPVKNWLKFFAAFTLICFSCVVANAQTKKKHIIHHRQKIDTSAMDLNSRISDSILHEAEIKDTTVPYMVNKIESYSFSLNRAENFFDRRLDTAGILKTLSGLERGLNYFHKRLDQTENPMNLRNLNTASVLLNESHETLEGWEKTLQEYTDQLNIIHQKIRLVKHDSSLLNDSLNTLLRGQMRAVYNRSLALDSVLHNSTIKINTLRNRVSINFLLVKDLQIELSDHRQAMSQLIWKQEEAPFFELCATDYDATLPEILQDGLTRSVRIIKFFMKTTWDTRSVNLGIWVFLLIWFLIIMRVLKRRPEPQPIIQNLTFLKKSAIICSLLLLFTYGPFLYGS